MSTRGQLRSALRLYEYFVLYSRLPEALSGPLLELLQNGYTVDSQY